MVVIDQPVPKQLLLQNNLVGKKDVEVEKREDHLELAKAPTEYLEKAPKTLQFMIARVPVQKTYLMIVL